MTLEAFREALAARGGGADVWAVCIEDANETRLTGAVALVPRAASWTRGGAYSLAHASHAAVPWRHAYVFHLWADTEWATTTEPRELAFETVFAAATGHPAVRLSPAAVAALL